MKAILAAEKKADDIEKRLTGNLEELQGIEKVSPTRVNKFLSLSPMDTEFYWFTVSFLMKNCFIVNVNTFSSPEATILLCCARN